MHTAKIFFHWLNLYGRLPAGRGSIWELGPSLELLHRAAMSQTSQWLLLHCLSACALQGDVYFGCEGQARSPCGWRE